MLYNPSMIKSYVMLDTNIWIYCCLASQEKFDHSALVKIKDALDKNSFKLLVPATIEAELSARIKEHLASLKANLNATAKGITQLEPYPFYKKAVLKKIDGLYDAAEENFAKAEKEIKVILSHESTIRLEITGDILAKAYVRTISRKRPHRVSKSKKTEEELNTHKITDIQSDSVIMEEVRSYLNGVENYKLLISSMDTDYLDETGALHSDIRQDFSDVSIYKNIRSLLAAFDIKLSQPKNRDTEEALVRLSSASASTFADSLLAAQKITSGFTDGLKLSAGITQSLTSNLDSLSSAALGISGSIAAMHNLTSITQRIEPLQTDLLKREVRIPEGLSDSGDSFTSTDITV